MLMRAGRISGAVAQEAHWPARTFYHPDYNRRLWALTRILHRRPKRRFRSRARRNFFRITAGGDFHPAPKIHCLADCSAGSI